MLSRLKTCPPLHGELSELAACVAVSPRTLYTWRAESVRESHERCVGRPARPAAEREAALAAVRAVLDTLPRGHDGWRSVQAELERRDRCVATRLVQELVRALKEERGKRAAEHLAKNRVHVEVLARDAVWGCDATLLAREGAGPLSAVCVRETFVSRTLSLGIGGEPDGADIERQLELSALTRGGWPLVVMLDNGGANRCEHLQARLRKERVIVLWNVPHTPQHNARTERGIGDVKRAAGLIASRARGGKAPAQQLSRSELLVRLVEAWIRLDRDCAREALSGLTPDELDRIAPRADACVRRARFYEDVSAELERVRAAHANPRERRRAERETIWCALGRYGLVTRTRGKCEVLAFKPEGVS